MARRLIALGSGLVLVAALTLVAWLAGHSRWRTTTRAGGLPEEDQGARRAVELRLALGRAEQRLDAARYRWRVDSLLAIASPADSVSLAVVVDSDGTGHEAGTARIARAVRGAWSDLGLGVTKVSVGMVLLDRSRARRWGQQIGMGGGDPTRFYLLPDSLAPSTCLAFAVLPPPGIPEAELRAKAAEWFGVCAFYARFGIPAERVRRWLTARSFDLTLAPDWAGQRSDGRLQIPWLIFASHAPTWYWRMLYLMPHDAAACFAGRGPACRATIREGDEGEGAMREGIVAHSDQSWNVTRQRMLGGEHFLGAVVREAGPRRFQGFWRTTLPVDSALTVALGQPAGEWAASWQGRIATRPHFGPGLRVWEVLIAILLITASVAAAAWSSRVKEVA